jgi:glucokinase
MVKRYPELLQSSHFRPAFENKGRHKVLLKVFPPG